MRLYTICYLSNGLRVKGLLAEPAAPGQYDGFLYLRGGIKSVGMVRPGRIIQFASQGFVVFAPFTEEIKEERAMRILPEKTGRMPFLHFNSFSRSKCQEGQNPYLRLFRGGIMGMLTAIEMGRQAASFVSWEASVI